MAAENGNRSLAVEAVAAPLFPFFLGCARSGTTLFRAIFTSHPDLAIPDEGRFFSVIVDKPRKYERPTGFDSERFVQDIFGRSSYPRWTTQDEVREALSSVPPASYADAVRGIYRLYAAKSGKSRYGDKTPQNAWTTVQLAEAFPEGRFVHIIRDGRDVAMSLMDRHWRKTHHAPGRIVEAARYWRRVVRAGRSAGRRIGPARYREVRYEALLEDPEDTVRSLCEFIDLPFDPVMLRYYEQEDLFGQRLKPAQLGRPGGGHHYAAQHEPPTKGLRDWRTQMSKSDLALFEVAAGDLLDELGYERGAKRMTAWTRASGRMRMIGSDVRSATSRLVRRARLMR